MRCSRAQTLIYVPAKIRRENVVTAKIREDILSAASSCYILNYRSET